MKKSHLKYIIALFVASNMLSSCKLEEYNPSTVTLEKAYNDKAGYEGLINSCYVDLYYFYGKVDFIGPTEAGTDSWINYGNSESGLALYNNSLTTETGTIRTVWGGLYSMINFCNTAIYYAQTVKGFSEEELKQKVAEAYFLRAFANFHLVEQFGNVVLRTESSAVDGVDITPKRNTEEEFYDLIISDLQYACNNLPVTQALKGRVSKKAAYAMLAKAYLQRTRLGNAQQYATLALQTAQELINNQTAYGTSLYTSDASVSGYSKLWSGANNKNNSEFLFIQAIDEASGYNPENWNRGRTRQYYLPDLRGKGAEWGTRETSVIYGRANSNYFKPTKYLLTEVFEPVENPADTRFAETFTYKFYSSKDLTITESMVNTYGKDASLTGHVIKSTLANYVGENYFWSWGLSNQEEQKNMTDDEGLSVITPNWTVPTDQKKLIPALVVDPTDLFKADGSYKVAADYPNNEGLMNMFPAMKKFSAQKYAYTNQYWMGDFPVIRLGEVYLIAAEAALLANNDQATAAQYVNAIRKRAAITSRESEVTVDASLMTVDYILKERGRELTGEHLRWYDLKRTNKLTKSYFQSTNPEAAENFTEVKHTKRPIPQSFLDAISNAGEFGTNGY